MNPDVDFICKIDRSLYRVVDQDLMTDDVIITEQQILHIEEGHPGDYSRLSVHIPEILQNPDYKPSAHRLGSEANHYTGTYRRNYIAAESFLRP